MQTSTYLVDSLRNELQYEVEVNLVLLLPRGVEEVHQLDDVAVLESPHDLQLAVLESLVLQDLLDGHHLAGLAQLGLVHDAEAAVADHL